MVVLQGERERQRGPQPPDPAARTSSLAGMSRPQRSSGVRDALLGACFLLAALCWMALVSSAVGLATDAGSGPGSLTLAVATLIQQLGLLAIAVYLAFLSPSVLKAVFALERVPTGVLLGAGAAGLLVGFVPDAIHRWLSQWMSGPGGAVEHLVGILQGDDSWARGILVVSAVLVAPVCEELTFRGFLWNSLRQRFSGTTTWLISSILFAAYHADPAHALAILPTGLLLGWMRLKTNSIWPGVCAHACNNGLAVIWLGVSLDGGGQAPPMPLVALSGVATAVAFIGFWRYAKGSNRTA